MFRGVFLVVLTKGVSGMPTEKISSNMFWLFIVLIIGVVWLSEIYTRTPESQAMEQCQNTCTYHGVQSYTPTTGCLCRD